MTERIINPKGRRELAGEETANVGEEIEEDKEERKKNGKEIPPFEGETMSTVAGAKIKAIADMEGGGARGRRVLDLMLQDQILPIVVIIGRRIGLLHYRPKNQLL